jgi:hypothetical protein
MGGKDALTGGKDAGVARKAPFQKMMEKQHMPKFQAQRDRKARKKNIARYHRTEEVEKYRQARPRFC